MKISTVMKDGELLQAIKKIDGVDVVQNYINLEDMMQENSEVLIISDQLININQIDKDEIRDKKIIYLISNKPDPKQILQIETLCASRGVITVPPKHSIDQIVEKVEESIFPERKDLKKSKVISFFGTHSGVGVTSTVLSIAYSLSKRSNSKIGVLSLNLWNPGDTIIRNDQAKYIEDLSSALNNKLLTVEQLIGSMVQKENFLFLAGNRELKLITTYNVDQFSFLIELARTYFDIVLIDAGCHFDNAGTAQSLLKADLKILLTSQERRGYERQWELNYNQILSPLQFTRSDFTLIVNKYEPQGIKAKHIGEQMGVNYLNNIPNIGYDGVLAEEEYKLLTEMENKEYHTRIDEIADTLIDSFKLQYRDGKKKKKSLFWRW